MSASACAAAAHCVVASCLIQLFPAAHPSSLLAQTPDARGFAPEAAAAQVRYESALLDAIHPDTLARWARALGARPHVAGTPGQEVTRDSVLAWLRRAGLSAQADTFVAYLPQPRRVAVVRLSPEPGPLPMTEPEIPEAGEPSRDPFPAFNAYTGAGQTDGELVFANYGLPEDYRVLDSLGVDVENRIVVARYGRSFRGIKAREAQRRGAKGLILYSDPADDGYRRGDVYPVGPMRPPYAVQRGSIKNGPGDPSTPDGPSLPGAPRITEVEMRGVARIPVVPLSYGAAADLLEDLTGPGAPDEWQGALPFFYRTGPGPVRVRLEVDVERGREAFHPIFNTIAVLPGSDLPDERIVIGAHRDAWGPGARDNVSGTVTVIAAAAAFARLARSGVPPRRTILFATWDAEEWGLIGSTEWVEAHAAEVESTVLAYLNQDSPVGGPDFGAAATPELKLLVREAAAAVPSPDGPGSVLARWNARSRGEGLNRQPRVGDLGGGSDHVPFVQKLGIPGAGFGFSGRWGVYHSAYDAADWMERFGDPGYRRHAAAASVLAVMTARLANAGILPYDFPGLAADLQKRIDEIGVELRQSDGAHRARPGLEAGIEQLDGEVMRFVVEAALIDSASVAALSAGADAEALKVANGHLRRAATSFVSVDGLPGTRGLRQLLYATDPDDGYATLALPSLRLAMRRDDQEELKRRLIELSGRVSAASAALRDARRALAEGVAAAE